MSSRTATCACRKLSVVCEGDPIACSFCFCTECQRRTGAAFGVGADYPARASRCSGTPKTFTRGSDSGRLLHMKFCPECGTTVYWEMQLLPLHFGVAAGAFNDPSFPVPHAAVFIDNKPDWLPLPHGVPSFPRAQM